MKNKLVLIIFLCATVGFILLGLGAQMGNNSIHLVFQDIYYTLVGKHLVFILGSFLLIKSILVFWFKEHLRAINFIIFHLLTDVVLAGASSYLIRYQGLTDVPRRYYRFNTFQSTNSFEQFNERLSYFVLFFGLNQLCFILLIILSSFYLKKRILRDPKLLDDDY